MILFNLWSWLEMSFTPQRYQFQIKQLSPLIFFRTQYPKMYIHMYWKDLLRVNRLRGTKTTFSRSPKMYDEYPNLFCIGFHITHRAPELPRGQWWKELRVLPKNSTQCITWPGPHLKCPMLCGGQCGLLMFSSRALEFSCNQDYRTITLYKVYQILCDYYDQCIVIWTCLVDNYQYLVKV